MKKLILLIVMILSFSSLCVTAKAEDKKSEYQEYVKEISAEYDMCPELIEALIEVESGWDAEAKNKGCIGLMQINKKWQKARMERLKVTDLKDPYSNILVGVDYLHELCEKYEDIGIALNAYNMGYKGVELGKKGKYIYYTRHILELAAELEELHGK